MAEQKQQHQHWSGDLCETVFPVGLPPFVAVVKAKRRAPSLLRYPLGATRAEGLSVEKKVIHLAEPFVMSS